MRERGKEEQQHVHAYLLRGSERATSWLACLLLLLVLLLDLPVEGTLLG
jgi:hypothetical protein